MGRWRMAAAGVLVLVGWGCASEADPTSSDVSQVLAAVERRSAEESDDRSTPAQLERAFEQMQSIGGDNVVEGLDADERACVETEFEERDIDLERIITDPAADDERVAFGQLLIDCVDDPAHLAPLITNGLSAMAPSMDLSDEEGECLVGAIVDEADDPARILMSGSGAMSDHDSDLLLGIFERCLSEENHAIFTGQPGAGPQSYGDDPRLDGMQDDCEAGELRACDLLWLVAGEGSDYEEVAATCGGSEEDTGEFCTEEAELDDSGFAPADSPGLRLLAGDCEDGDLTACDLLYQLAPLGHELENVGYTCGGRIAVGAVPDCRTRLG